jgi:hypothetical protein
LLRSISNIDEFAVQVDQYNLKFAEEIKWFNSNHLLINHMKSIGCSVSLTNYFLFGEEEVDNHDPQTIFFEKKTKDIDTFISIIEQNKKRERLANERSTRYPIGSQRRSPQKKNSQSVVQEKNNSLTNHSDHRGDQIPLKGNLE